METITISVDSEIKTAFEQATPETLQKLTTFLNLLFYYSKINNWRKRLQKIQMKLKKIGDLPNKIPMPE